MTVTTGENVGSMGRMVTIEAEEVGMVWTIVETTTVWVVVFVPA